MITCKPISNTVPVGLTYSGVTRTVTKCETHDVEMESSTDLCLVGKVEKAVEDGIARIAELRIGLLNLERGDILVVKSDREPAKRWEHLLPPGVRVLYIPNDVDLSVLTYAEIEARIKSAN